MPSRVPQGQRRGWIIAIGGAENKENDRRILERFVSASGGEQADIVVIPTASRMHETGPRYEHLFSDSGAARVTVMDFDTRRDCKEPGRLRRIEEASGIFFTGETNCGSRPCWEGLPWRNSFAAAMRTASPSGAPAPARAS